MPLFFYVDIEEYMDFNCYTYICRVTFMSAEKYNIKTKKFKGDSYGEKSEKTDYITFKRYAW